MYYTPKRNRELPKNDAKNAWTLHAKRKWKKKWAVVKSEIVNMQMAHARPKSPN
jgi:hypothetical protein